MRSCSGNHPKTYPSSSSQECPLSWQQAANIIVDGIAYDPALVSPRQSKTAKVSLSCRQTSSQTLPQEQPAFASGQLPFPAALDQWALCFSVHGSTTLHARGHSAPGPAPYPYNGRETRPQPLRIPFATVGLPACLCFQDYEVLEFNSNASC